MVSCRTPVKTFFENSVFCDHTDRPTGNVVFITFTMIDPINYKTVGVQSHAIVNSTHLDSEFISLKTQFLESLGNFS